MLALEVKNLNVFTKKGQNYLVKNISFSLKAGQTLALMGPSGCGKSLTSMALTNALPQSLCSKADYINFSSPRPALIMQNPADCFDQLFSINHSISMALASKQNEVNTVKLLEEVGFEQAQNILKCYPFELSGGMLHKVMLAIAIAQVQIGQASCIIADEPIAGLDSTAKLNNLKLLKTLQKKYNFALLYIDHDLSHAKFMAEDLAIMYDGQLVEYASLNEVLSKPQHFYTKALLDTLERLNISNHTYDNIKNINPILTCNKLKKSYSTGLALDNISFEVSRNQNLGIVGHNGAGKSTLVRALLALEKLDDGKVHILNKDQNPICQGWRKHIQAVFQHPRMSVNPRMKVKDIILEPLIAHGFKAKDCSTLEVEKLLNIVQLPPRYAKAYPNQMSGGQLQRLCIARALALKPDILILDEPLTDLDSVVAEKILHMLEDIKQQLNITLIYISHDLRSVLRLCERILVLEQGKIVDDFLSQDYNHSNRHQAFKTLAQHSNFTLHA